MPTRRRLLLAPGLTLLATAACRDAVTADVARPELRVVGVSDSVFVTDVVQLRTTLANARGDSVGQPPTTWTTSTPQIAELSRLGYLTALRPGVAEVVATSGALTARTRVVVHPLLVLRVQVFPLSTVLAVGDVVPIGVWPLGNGGRTVLGRLTTLGTADSSVAVVDSAGRLRAVAPGRTTVRALVDGVLGTREVTVVGTRPAGAP